MHLTVGIAAIAYQPWPIEEGVALLALALQIEPEAIAVPTSLPRPQKALWLKSLNTRAASAAGAIVGLSRTGAVGLGPWMVMLLVMVLQVTPAEASFLAIWISLAEIARSRFGCLITDRMGRRSAGASAASWRR